MDPTSTIPLHFTVETVALTSAGLVLAWSALRRRWTAAAAAAVLVLVQALHAGQYIGEEDAPALVAMRLASIAGIALSILPIGAGRPALVSGVALLIAGTLWGAAAGGDELHLAVGAHLVLLAGAVALAVWVWQAARPSVRLRILAAFVAVLAVAVVVAGGAVARVAAVDSRDAVFSRVAQHAATVRGIVAQARDGQRRRAASIAPSLTAALETGPAEIDASRLPDETWAVLVDRDGRAVAAAQAEGAVVPYSRGAVAKLPVVAQAMRALVSSTEDVAPEGLVVVAAAPVLRAGAPSTPEGVIGVVVLGRVLSAESLRTVSGDDRIQIGLVAGGRSTSTHPDLDPTDAPAGAGASISRSEVEAPGRRWFAAVVPLPEGGARAVVATSSGDLARRANDLVRAFLVAILAAALLAVVAALWLSSRLTRPMLELAEEAERVKTDFLASVSHELRTPLTPIRGYAEMLRDRRIPAREQDEFLDEIGVAAKRLERIVALLVDVAAIEAGRFRVDPVEVPAASVLGDAGSRWRGRSRRHKIQVDAPASLPAVLADPDPIARVLDELIDNAIKFAPKGVVELRGRKKTDGVEFAVIDSGPGIDQERLDAVREAFRQSDTGDTRRYGGLGLGLTFAEGVLDAHGSQLVIDTAPGRGTTCSFVLPAASSVTRMPRRAATRKR